MRSKNIDKELAKRFRRYASFQTETDPVAHYYGENPAEEVNRLLDIYVSSQTRFLDVGCGAGQTITRIAPQVAEAWGIDMQPDLLNGAHHRARDAGLTNVSLLEGNASVEADTSSLPDDYFDLALSQRGPDFNPSIVSKLKRDAIVVQERIGDFSFYPLGIIFGRQTYAPYHFNNREVMLHKYADMELFPVSFKEHFYESFYRDIEHLEADLKNVPALLYNWRVGELRPYEAERDRTALELYARYNTTSKGIRLLEHRIILVFRRAVVSYYPVDGLDLIAM
jgi:SAM-dependent methyltransferase